MYNLFEKVFLQILLLCVLTTTMMGKDEPPVKKVKVEFAILKVRLIIRRLKILYLSELWKLVSKVVDVAQRDSYYLNNNLIELSKNLILCYYYLIYSDTVQ